MTMVNSDPSKMNLSFSGCGFLCIYHAGVAAAIKTYAPQLTQQKISGASAGSIVAAGLICDVCISEATNSILKIVKEARTNALGALHPSFNLLGLVRQEIVRTLPPDAYKRCTNRLQISLTRWRDKTNVVVSEYKNNQELIDAIICSCYIPIYCGLKIPKYRGEEYVDGGFTDNQPSYDDHTVTVSPFSGESDICPSDLDSSGFFGIEFSRTSIRFTTKNLFRVTACLMPPTTDDCSKMCLQGFEDALRFLTRNGMTPCMRCLTIQTNISNPQSSVVSSVERNCSPFARPHARPRNPLPKSSSRRRLESECDTCYESEHAYDVQISDIFPTIMKRTLDEAAYAEENLFKYLLSFRLFRYARTVFGVTKLPVDMILILAKNAMIWLSQIVGPPAWITEYIEAISNFIYSEIEQQRSKFSARYSCQLAITETDYDCVGQTFVKQSFGNIDLSTEAQRELSALREKDRKHKGKKNKRSEAKDSAASTSSRKSASIDSYDTDSLAHVIDYTAHHEAAYAFHYLDENNKVRNIEVFNVAQADRPCPTPPRHHKKLSSRPVSTVEEEPEIVELKNMEADSNPIPIGDQNKDECDSGLSVEESSSSSKRDACCSPVRHLSNCPRGHRPVRSATLRRSHPNTAQPSRKSSSVPVSSRDPMSPSSDSDAEASDRFFVPRGRQRTTSKEYDGEPEQSDTDITP